MPNTVVIHVSTGRILDLTDLPSLGHPDRPGLLHELYYSRRTPRYRPGELRCPDCQENNPDCPEWMYLRRRLGRFHAVHRNMLLGDHGESDTHKALKARMVAAATRGGLTAVAESRAAHGRRITDVVVTGGAQDLACEAQISYATAASVRERASRATADGLTPLWTTLNSAADWIGRVPWARLDRKPWDYYRDETELPVLGGVRTLIIEECGRTGSVCPDRRRGRRCTGRHGRWQPAQVTHFDDLIVRAAYGQFLPYQDRSTRRGNWFWVLPQDLERVRHEDDDADQLEAGRRPGSALAGEDPRELDPTCDYGASHSRRTPLKPGVSLPAEAPVLVSLAEPQQPIAVPRQMVIKALTSTDLRDRPYRQRVINPGTLPIEDAREDLAATNLATFLEAVRVRAAEVEEVTIRHRVAGVSGDPVRVAAADRDGRFGWDIPFSDGHAARVLIPGVEQARLRDDRSAAAPCLFVNGLAWWWHDAVSAVAGQGVALREP